MALPRSPCRGLLLSRRRSGHRTGDELRTSDDAGGADQAAVLVALFGQRNFEKVLASFDDDDRCSGRFAASRQFASDLRGMLPCQGGIRKHLADVILECRWSVPVMKIIASHGFPRSIECPAISYEKVHST
jgi:hypothetical protein